MARILIDVDCVLGMCMELCLDRFEAWCGVHIPYESILNGNLEKHPHGSHFMDIFETTGFFSDMGVYPGSAEGISRLKEFGHEVLIVTATKPRHIDERHDWLMRHFGHVIESRDVIYSARKDVVSGDVLLDDALFNLRDSRCPVNVRYRQPWNENPTDKYESLSKTPIVSNMQEFVLLVEKLFPSVPKERCPHVEREDDSGGTQEMVRPPECHPSHQ